MRATLYSEPVLRWLCRATRDREGVTRLVTGRLHLGAATAASAAAAQLAIDIL